MEAASGFIRIKIRVPEGYLLVGPYETTRPALLVVDADGRRVDSIKLLGAEAGEVAKRLVAARELAPTEWWDFTVGKERKQVRVKAGTFKLPEGAVVHHPVAVRCVKPLPGTWLSVGDRRYVPALLAHPVEGIESDLEARAFSLPNVAKGGLGARVAKAPLSVEGVLSVFPDIFAERQVVVGRKGDVDWKAVRKAFVDAGCDAK